MIHIEGMKKDRGQKIALIEVVKNDMSIKEVAKSVTLVRIEWPKRILVTNPNLSVEDP